MDSSKVNSLHQAVAKALETIALLNRALLDDDACGGFYGDTSSTVTGNSKVISIYPIVLMYIDAMKQMTTSECEDKDKILDAWNDCVSESEFCASESGSSGNSICDETA